MRLLSKHIRYALPAIATCAVIFLASILYVADVHAVWFPDDVLPKVEHRYGTIAAKGVVLGPNGKPIWVEYDKEGNEVGEIGEAIGKYEGARVMSADAYRAYVQAFRDVEAEHSANMEILSREDYESRTFTRPDGEEIPKPWLQPNTQSVVVKKVVYHSYELVLHESPLDLNRLEDLPDSTRAVLLKWKGQVIDKSDLNIGYRAAFYTSNDPKRNALGKKGLQGYDRNEDNLWAPIVGAKVEVLTGRRYLTISDRDGNYVLIYFLPPCPCFHYLYDLAITAEVRYRRFDPKRDPIGSYLVMRYGTAFCQGYSACLPMMDLTSLMVGITIKGIEMTAVKPPSTLHFPIDAVMLSGEGILKNRKDPIPLAGGKNQHH